MFTLIGIIAGIFWIDRTFGGPWAGLTVIALVIGFLVLGAKLDTDEWKARCNCVRYWKDRRE